MGQVGTGYVYPSLDHFNLLFLSLAMDKRQCCFLKRFYTRFRNINSGCVWEISSNPIPSGCYGKAGLYHHTETLSSFIPQYVFQVLVSTIRKYNAYQI